MLVNYRYLIVCLKVLDLVVDEGRVLRTQTQLRRLIMREIKLIMRWFAHTQFLVEDGWSKQDYHHPMDQSSSKLIGILANLFYIMKIRSLLINKSIHSWARRWSAIPVNTESIYE